MSIVTDIENLIAEAELGKAIDKLRDYAKEVNLSNASDSLILLRGRYAQNEKRFSRTTISVDNYNLENALIKDALMSILKEVESNEAKDQGQKQDAPTSGGKPLVFISYRHADRDMAVKVRAFLEENGIGIIIDEKDLLPGGNIKDFIIQSIKRSDFTLSLVSTKSLMSSWVTMEGGLTFQLEQFGTETRFIASSLDHEFFANGFVNDRIKEAIAHIKQLKADRQERLDINSMLDTSDLDTEIDRYTKMMQVLPSTVNRLKENLTVDISGDNFEQGMNNVLRALRN